MWHYYLHFCLLLNILWSKICLTKTAFISTALVALAWSLIEPSRFSWNPNLLAQFTFFATYALVKSVQSGKRVWFILFGFMSAIIIQLHYLALIALPAFFIFIAINILQANKKRPIIINVLVSLAVFGIMSIPLLIFDLRHDFLNYKNFIQLFTTDSGVNRTGSITEIVNTFLTFNSYIFQYTFSYITNALMLGFILIMTLLNARSKSPLFIVIITLLTLLGGASLLQGTRHPHYFNSLYILYLVVIGYLLSHLTSKKIGWIAVFIFLIAYGTLNYVKYVYVVSSPSLQIKRAKLIARSIYANVSTKNYSVTALPNQYSDSTYRYFLELWNKRPTEKDSLIKTDELFVVCEGPCNPIGNPQWDIAYFAPNNVVHKNTVDDVTIYKLTR